MMTSLDHALSAARGAFDAAIDAAAPAKVMASALAGLKTPPTKIIAVGKAAGPMAKACRDAGLTADGVLVTHDASVQVEGFVKFVGGHPVPNENSVRAARHIMALAEGLNADDHLLMLVSGGGSALMCLPADGMTLEQKIAINDALLGAGLDIHQMNAVRRLCSGIKGGRLAQAAAPATITQWVMSDVPASGDRDRDLAAIASGPMAADPVAYDDAVDLLRTAGLDRIDGVRQHLMSAAASDHPRRKGEACFDRVTTSILASNDLCRRAAEQQFGGAVTILPDLTGDAGAMGRELANHALDHGLNHGPDNGPDQGWRMVGVTGGETVITLPPDHDPLAKGGRSQHLALSVMIAMHEAKIAGRDVPNWAILAAGTDGRDGPTDAAGALLHHGMLTGKAELEAARQALQRYDSWGFLDELGGLIRIPPTGTNLADIAILLTW